MAAANAQIGVAKAAWFPQLTLSPTYIGYESAQLAKLISAPALVWALGLQAGQTLFDNGKTRAGINYAEAGYQAAAASYRQTVLQAMQETQDALSTLQGLNQASQQQGPPSAASNAPMIFPCCATARGWTTPSRWPSTSKACSALNACNRSCVAASLSGV
jgi:hypothetical protein